MDNRTALNRLLGSPATRKLARWGITLAVIGLVVWFAGDTLSQGWSQLATSQISILWPWVAISAVLYVVGLAPMAFYWRAALRSLGQQPPTMEVVRAYYLGHLGKYVPGKALVAVLRTGALVRSGASMRPTVVSVFLETLTFMATGGALAALLLVTSGDGPVTYAWLAGGLALLVGLPVTPPVARRLAARVLAGQEAEQESAAKMEVVGDPLAGITWQLTALGVTCATLAWTVLGLSLWAAVRALGVGHASPITQLPLWIEGVTLPVVAGFLSLIPGGLMVRDVLQVELLTPMVPAETALVVAVLWRFISVASEGATCAIMETSRLYRAKSPPT